MTTSQVASVAARWSVATFASAVLLCGALFAQNDAGDPFNRAGGLRGPMFAPPSDGDQTLPTPMLNPAQGKPRGPILDPAARQPSWRADAAYDQRPTAPRSTPQADFRQAVPRSRFNAAAAAARAGDRGALRTPIGQPARISTRQSTFAIPFTVAKPAAGRGAPKEVQLYVSSPGQTEWHIDGRVAPNEGRFLFRSPRDGEYWFQVRTVDTHGQLIGTPSNEPGLRVLVDTTVPELDVQAQMLADGKLDITWQVTDPHLQPESLKLEYQLASNSPWHPIPGLDPLAWAVDESGKLAGRFAWPLGVQEGAISIRGEVADAAGNRNLVMRRVHVSEQLTTLREHQRTNEANRQRQLAAQANQRGSQQLFTGYSPNPTREGQGDAPPTTINQRPMSRNGSTAWPADDIAGQPPMQQIERSLDNAPGTTTAWPVSQAAPRTGAAHPPIAERYEPPTARTTRPPATAEQGPRYVRSKSFLLDYGVDSLTGVQKRIVLWATRDGGRTWQRFGEDGDAQSPFTVTVADPGLYGFSIVAEPADTAQEYVPRSGEPAQSWIMVDPNPPAAKLTSVQLDPSGETAQLRIRWEAFDDNLVERPISIYLGERLDGQWFRIATDLPNSGQYTWRLDEGLPPEIYLRLVVRDQAGHVTEHVAQQPIRLDELRPAVEIHGVRSSQRAPERVLILQ